MLVIAGWCCCDCWEKWDKWREENYGIAAESLRSQVRRARRHPSLIAWWYGSDFPPPVTDGFQASAHAGGSTVASAAEANTSLPR